MIQCCCWCLLFTRRNTCIHISRLSHQILIIKLLWLLLNHELVLVMMFRKQRIRPLFITKNIIYIAIWIKIGIGIKQHLFSNSSSTRCFLIYLFMSFISICCISTSNRCFLMSIILSLTILWIVLGFWRLHFCCIVHAFNDF